MAEPLYLHRKRQTKRGLKLTPKMFADGKEKRKDDGRGGIERALETRESEDREAPISIEAKMFSRARAGDERARDYLLSWLTTHIQITAKAKNWKIDLEGGRAYKLAVILFAPHFQNERYTDDTAAEKLEIGRNKFQLNWKPKMTGFESLIESWRYQLEGCLQ